MSIHIRVVCIVAMSFLAACTKEQEPAQVSGTDPLIIKTYNGTLAGHWASGTADVRVFRAIPYAKPPVGRLRWQAPQAPENWQGTRAATEFEKPCWQAHSEDAFVWTRGTFERSEDCLHLSVWSQNDRDPARPVMVWFHGGAHTGGWGHNKIFDGTQLAKLGVVLVSINYRLGPWGFLAHPALAQESVHESAGNYGLLDKIAALNWVRDNIEQFGGDPDNVTIFGQSAGSNSVCALMASPLSRGLFHKAIGQSASCLNPITRDANGLDRGLLYGQALGVPQTVDDLRNVSNEALLQATTIPAWSQQSKIVVDGWVLPKSPLEVFRAGEQAKVPLLVGSLANEGNRLFALNAELTESQFDIYLERTFGTTGADIKEAYGEELAQSPGLAQREIATDLFMAFGMRQWAGFSSHANQPTYLYFMSHVPPAFRIYMADDPELELPGGPRSAGAYHSGDLAFVFGNVGQVGAYWQERDVRLASVMSRYWTNFAKTGDPNGTDLPRWANYDPDEHTTQVLDADIHAIAGARRDKLDLFAKEFPLYE